GTVRGGDRDLLSELVLKEIAERPDVFGGDRQPRGHRMSAAGDEQSRLFRGEHRLPQIDPGDRTPRSLADPGFVERDDDRRAAELFLEPPRDDPDHPGMPAAPPR